MKLWKTLGLAGLAGVATTGAIIARDQRKRAQLSPDEIRGRLQDRYQRLAQEAAQGADQAAGGVTQSRGGSGTPAR